MIATVMAILAGIAAFAVAIKSLPTIWQGVKSSYRFFLGMERVTIIPDLFANQQIIMSNNEEFGYKLDETLAALKTHMIDEEEILNHEKNLVRKLAERIDDLAATISQNSSRIANVVFRQAVFADSLAYYTVELHDNAWQWTWGNRAYFNLTGMTPEECVSGHYWDIVKEDQRSWVVDYISNVAESGEPLDVDFTLVNVKSHQEHEVRVLAWPLHDNDGNAIVYLGAVEKRNDVGIEKP